MKLAIILGTRPEIIKLFSIIQLCRDENLEFILIHSNQHYSRNMDRVFFKELDLPEPDYSLDVGSDTANRQIGGILLGLDSILKNENPDIVIVQGDTNTVFAGGFAASRLNIPVAHVEAGLRSWDRNMPEEINRILVDHLADFLFCPTDEQKKNLHREGIDTNKIFIVGNTIVDAVQVISKKDSDIFSQLGLKEKEYALLTMHRAENVDDEKRLAYLLNELGRVKEKIIYPLHPRTKKQMEKFMLMFPKNMLLSGPINFTQMLSLERHAKFILTDSGGVQEEACILKVPCITLRTSTERPETIHVGANKLLEDIVTDIDVMLKKNNSWKNPFGNGNAGRKIIQTLQDQSL